MPRVLMIAYYFPPLGGIGSLRAAKFASYLPEFDWEPTVVAPRNGAYYRDESLAVVEQRVIRTGSLELSRLGKRAVGLPASDTKAAAVGHSRRRLRDLARRWLYFPDAQVGWYPFAIRAARRALRQTRYDAIFSSSFPITAHVVAQRVSRDFGVPWVAEFRDPWTEQLHFEAPRRAAALRLEHSLMSAASSVIAPSEDWARLYKSKGAGRVAVITNGFDQEDLPPAVPSASFVVTYVGSQYPERQDLSAMWPALASLRRAGEIRDLTIRFVGDLAGSVRAGIQRAGLQSSLEVTGFLPHRQALAVMCRSSLLLLAGPRRGDEAERGWITAKVFEYLATGLPILYIGDPTVEIARVLAAQPGCFVVPSDREDLVRQAIHAGTTEPLAHRKLDAFTRRRLAEQLAGVLREAAQ